METQPCSSCPFVGIPGDSPRRIMAAMGEILCGHVHLCHLTVDHNRSDAVRWTGRERDCVGALQLTPGRGRRQVARSCAVPSLESWKAHLINQLQGNEWSNDPIVVRFRQELADCNHILASANPEQAAYVYLEEH